MNPKHLLQGESFGIYYVVKDTGKRTAASQKFWEVECTKCKKRKELTTSILRSGRTVDYCDCMKSSKTGNSAKVIPFPNLRTKAGQREARLVKRKKVKLDYYKPTTRGECSGGIRPCPYVSCKHNLYLEVKDSGSIVINNPDVSPDEVEGESCCLDVADKGGLTSRAVGELMNITQQRVDEIEKAALKKLKKHIEKTNNVDMMLEGKEFTRGTQDGYITKKEEQEIHDWAQRAVV